LKVQEINLSKLGGWKNACAVLLFCGIAAIASPAQTFTTLSSFDYNNGLLPLGTLVQGFDGNLYGTTESGGIPPGQQGDGTVFRITPSGAITSLYTFCITGNCPDGDSPFAGLVQAKTGDFYGTTYRGGPFSHACKADGCGTIFKITPSGTWTRLHSFVLTDGSQPLGGLVQGIDGNLYGTTYIGGVCKFSTGCGTIFKITPAGVLTTLYNFCAQTKCSDGQTPESALVQGIDGDFYGTTAFGGILACTYQGNPETCGTIFKITSTGVLTTLYRFSNTDGSVPLAGLVLGNDGNFYGTTSEGGANNVGTIFKITRAGKLTVLHSFDSSDGADPVAGLVQATDGNFYGVTYSGGANNYGTLFEITSTGTFSTLHSFDATDGQTPYGGLIQGTDGNIYGTTSLGGAPCPEFVNGGCGTVFKLSLGLAPFVETNLGAAKVGGPVIILGTDLTGTTAVSFGGTTAAFTTVSATEIKATVPAGAKTGFIEVTTPSGSLQSNVRFLVMP
jgi:uncharacterized repeat protein (TIGR03803 family)